MDYYTFVEALQTNEHMPDYIPKSRGFEGELIIEIPGVAIDQSRESPLIHGIFISKMGHYPKAMHHYYQRPRGISQVILLYCTHGKGWIQLKHQNVTVEAGELFLIPANTSHSYGADKENPWTIYWFHLAGNQCNESIRALFGSRDKIMKALRVGFSEKRDAIFKQIGATFMKGYSATNLLFANLLLRYYLATFVATEQFQEEATPPEQVSSTDKAILFMQKNLSKPVTLENIARSAHLSISFFSRKFRHDTGYAPVEYFNHLRVQKACQLLHFTKMRVNEVASLIGIDDPFYFSRLFKQQMGMSPVSYRKNE